MNCLILGCGYAGKRIAAHLISRGHQVTGTTTHESHLGELKKYCSQAFFFKGNDAHTLSRLLNDHQAIIVTAAPKTSQDYENTYLELAKNIVSQSVTEKILIYTSSTSVYMENCGNYIDERALLDMENPISEILQRTEKLYLSLNERNWRVCIFRLSEIYGPEREIKLKLTKMSSVPFAGSGDRYANLIHVDDIAGAVVFAVENPIEGLFNLSCDEHPTRKDLYDAVCVKYGLPKCEWDSNRPLMHGGNKRILNQKIKSAGYSFKHPQIVK